MFREIKILLSLVLVITMMSVSYEAAAVSDIALATRKAELQALSKKLKARDVNDRQQVREIARRTGITVRRELPNGKVLELQRFIPGIGPVFYVTHNIDAADTVSTDEVWPGGSAGLNLDGTDLDGFGLIIGEWDGGAVAEHTDFLGRLTQVDADTATTVSDHATHVAGTLIGAGGLPNARGMAYAAHLNAYDWISDTAEMATAASLGLMVSNNSYGIAAGWIKVDDPDTTEWWWIGGAGDEDPNFGYYNSETQLWDEIAFDAPYYLIVKAAGNDRWDIGPESGEAYTIVNQDGEPQSPPSTTPRPADCAPAGYDCLSTTSVAKNILTVGAVDDVIGGYLPLAGSSAVQMTGFSGWGPTDDGRIKPDVVGNGWLLLSTYVSADGGDSYAAAIGTSMAAPNVAGSLLLLQGHYQDIHGANSFMRAATLKALAIHTADEAGSADGPDYEYGWGLLNTKTAAQVITEDYSGTIHQIVENSLSNGGENTVPFTVSVADAIITATLVWTDPPGTPVTPLTLDSPDSMLVNDLDLRITSGASTYEPWVLNPASPAAAATTGDNNRDNVEQVVVNGATTGITYNVEVSHKGTLLNGLAQNYSLIISEAPPPPTSSGLLIDEDFSGGLPAGWSVDAISEISWEIKSPIPGDLRYDNNTGGAGNYAMVDFGPWVDAITSLRTPTYDLSSTEAAVLRFKNYFLFDEYESINVDVSTNGGADWINVWKHYGLLSGLVSRDLSDTIAGQSSVSLRFRFENRDWGYPTGNIWQLDDVELEIFGGSPPPPPPGGDLPGLASNPNPADGVSGVVVDTTLSWSAGALAASHDVYSGASNPPATQGNQADPSFDPGTLAYATTYYWRIDEVNSDGTTPGNSWSFTTGAAPANVAPTADFTFTTTDLTANFTDMSSDSDGSVDAWSWDFGDGNNSSVQNPSHLYVSAGTYTVTLVVTDNDSDTDIFNNTSVSVTEPPAPAPYVDQQATGETLVAGTVSGIYTNTHDDDDGYIQTITERDSGGKPANRFSFLEHSWHFSVSPGAMVTLTANVWSSTFTEGSTFLFDYSLNGGSYTEMFPVSSISDTNMQSYVFPVSLSGTVTVRVRDTNRISGDRVQEMIFVDYLVIRSENAAAGDPPAAPSNLTSIAISSSQIDLAWSDIADNESGFQVERSEDAGFSLTQTATVDANITSYSDTGLSGATTYYYRVAAYNGSGASAYSNTADATTEAAADTAITLNATGYKVKGVQYVDLNWSGTTAANVDIHRNESLHVTAADVGDYIDNIGKKGGASYDYMVCEAGTSNCSALVSVIF